MAKTYHDILKTYSDDPNVLSIVNAVAKHKSQVGIKGLAGGSEVFIVGSIFRSLSKCQVIVCHDWEEANALFSDLKQILDPRLVKLFPSSFKKPYEFEETENANVLERAEVLSALNKENQDPFLIISYPNALAEKVLNKKTLVENTFSGNLGDTLDVDFLTEFMHEYGFEMVDFVYEPGDFAVRGGIIDVYSFSSNKPFRLELFGDIIESIRTFNPDSQLSDQDLESFNIVPNIQHSLQKEERESFLRFLPEDAIVWIKDFSESLDIVDKSFDKAKDSFDAIVGSSGDIRIVGDPKTRFETTESYKSDVQNYSLIEFGKRFHFKHDLTIQLDFKPQPSFGKKFDLLIKEVNELEERGFTTYLTSDSPKQIERLGTIFQEVQGRENFEGVHLGLSTGFIDSLEKLAVFTDHQIFERFHQSQSAGKFSKKKALTLKELKSLQTGDYVVHIDHGVARFAGLDTIENNGNRQEVLRLVYKDNDLLYVSVHSLHKISKYSGKEGEPPTTSKLGGQEWQTKKKRVKKKVKDIAKDLISLYAKRKSAPGFAFPSDDYMQIELESSFMYEDTPDQGQATSDVKSDMELSYPMDRLVCGDVGFGKTEVAIRAAFKAVNAGKQVAVLVPTTILAMQHHRTFEKRLENFPVTVDFINRFKSTAEISKTKKSLADGKTDIIIGTHRIINKDIQFKDLGLLVIDEEQKFGVKAKERIKEMRVNVDALTLTATPIPRTLHFSLMGARDLSIISTPPPNRRPVTTEIHEFGNEVIRDAISHELRRNGQVFFVHNRIADIEQIANTVVQLVPEARISIAHGQMEGSKLEKVMMKFIEGETDVLISTNIIESGLDIPNANTIIINRANMFGLSDLHQMRGRVGRSNTKAYCFLLTSASNGLSSDARKRLYTLEEFSDLGDGFKVAMRDLDIRGAGNLLGSEQSGFINDMGFDMYHKILDEAVQELKETEFKDLFQKDLIHNESLENLRQECIIETDLELLIPNDYVNSTTERLQLYTELDDTSTPEELETYRTNISDRFGEIPACVNDLIESVPLRWLGMRLGFEKIVLRNQELKCYISDTKDKSYFQSALFGNILKYVQSNGTRSQMKEYKNKLILKLAEVEKLEQAIFVLNEMLNPKTHAIAQ